MGLKGFLTTLGLGVGAMYFLDPDRGNRRRALVRDQIVSLRHEAEDVWTKGSEDIANRAKGLRYKAGSAAEDAVRSGKDAINLDGGEMRLNMDMNRPGDRLLAMSGGGLMALYGLTRGGLLGKIATLAGLNFVAKGLIQKDLLGDVAKRFSGETMGGAGIEFRKAIRINAPVEQVYNFWTNYDNFPRFMSHLKEVRDTGSGDSHWVANGPAGMPIEWDAQITQMQPNRVIAWESLPGSEVYNAGRVRFESVEGATRLDVFMTYNPPGGVAGHAIAQLFGVDPKAAMDDDLLKLKSLLEEGGSREYASGSNRRGRADNGTQGAGGDSGMNALAQDITGGSLGEDMGGYSGEGNPPSERKPGAESGELPGVGS